MEMFFLAFYLRITSITVMTQAMISQVSWPTRFYCIEKYHCRHNDCTEIVTRGQREAPALSETTSMMVIHNHNQQQPFLHTNNSSPGLERYSAMRTWYFPPSVHFLQSTVCACTACIGGALYWPSAATPGGDLLCTMCIWMLMMV